MDDKLKYPELYRIELTAKMIKDTADGEYITTVIGREDWLWYNLAEALDDIAKGLRRINEKLEGACNHK